MNSDSDALKSLIAKIDPSEATPKKDKPTVDNGVLFQSNLSRKLDSQTVQNICDSTVSELKKMELDLGRNITANSGDISGEGAWWQNISTEGIYGIQPHTTFMGERQLMNMTFHNQIEWRKYVYPGLFTESNFTMPISGRATRQNIARAIKSYLGVDPWVVTTATNKPDGSISPDDQKIATAGGRFFDFKATEAEVKSVISRGFEKAYITGECVIKCRHSKRQSYYSTDLTVLVNDQGAFILGADGDYIVEGKDSFAPKAQQIAPVDEMGQPLAVGIAPALDEEIDPTVLYLQRDGTTAIPPGSRFEFREDLLRLQSNYDGPVLEIVPTQDFLCSQTEPSIQTAPMIAQIVSVTPYEVVQSFGQNDLEGLSTEDKLSQTVKFIQLLTNMESDGSSPKTASDMGRPELGEDGLNQLAGNTRSEFAEVYRNYDADGDGSPEEIFMLIDRRRNQIVFMDYLQNVSITGKRPFSVLTVNRVDGRWHGVSMMKKLDCLQRSIDIFLNRLAYSTSSTGTTTFFRSEDVTEGDAYARGGMPLPFNCGTTYHPKSGKDPSQILTYVTIPNVKYEEFNGLMQLFMQMATNEGGVLGANDQQTAGLDSSQLATGIRDAATKADEMFYYVASSLNDGVNDTVQNFAKVLFDNMNDLESYEWSEGDTRLTDELKKTDANRMKYFFRLTMTGGKNEQKVAAMSTAMPQVMTWAQQPAAMMVATRSLIDTYLKALQIDGVDAVLDGMIAAKQNQEQMAMAAAQMQAQQLPPSK